MLETNRGVKMTIIGTVAGVVVRIGLCFVPQVPPDIANQIMYGIWGMFGLNVAAQKYADGKSGGATATVGCNAANKQNVVAPTPPLPPASDTTEGA